jgi:mono/diheme cytochrome c family protein
MRRLILLLLTSAVLGGGVFWLLTRPDTLPANAFAGITGDPARGEPVFWAAGCASCHMADGAKGDAQLVLSGGQKFPSDFGTFLAPNISPDPTHGIGGWDLPMFANAIMRGVSPKGQHYYPVLPYNAYNKMDLQDVADLKAFMDALPPSANPSLPHELSFPFTIRRGLGLWKLLFVKTDWVIQSDLPSPALRGRYIAEALAHCGECHTPRNPIGGLNRAAWLSGAPNPSGKGTIPNITPGKLDWSEDEIVEYLTSGFTPEYDSVGGHMVHVVENMARLPQSDRQSVAAYLKQVPAIQ